MSAVPAPVIRHPQDMLPDIAFGDDERVKLVFSSLTEDGAKEFSQEIVEAVILSKSQSDLRPLNDVIEAWFRSLVFLETPGFVEDLKQAFLKAEDGPKYSAETLQERRKHALA